MIDIPGYKNPVCLFNNITSSIYQYCKEKENGFIIVKSIPDEVKMNKEVLLLKNEFEITKSLQIPGIRKAVFLKKIKNFTLLGLEYTEGDTLKNIFKDKIENLSEFLRIGISLANTLGHLHEKNIIHRDINPNNIIYEQISGKVTIIDFGIAIQFSVKILPSVTVNKLEGTLKYISPEQTGRMNRRIDYRSDLYSLGITLYELLTGVCPFEADDPLEIIHSHIARVVPDPESIRPDVPPIISAILLKLLEKNQESRYKSAFGLKRDLEECLQNIKGIYTLDFPPGKRDYSGKLQIPEKIYGRTEQVISLFDCYEQACTGIPGILLIGSPSGYGKTSLVQEVYKILKITSGIKTYFISGKFDILNKNTPYLAFTEAFKELIQQITLEENEAIQYWKKKLKNSIGELGYVIKELVPNLSLLVETPSSIPEIGFSEERNRFHYVFSNFISAITEKEHPLIIFLDDFQWADSASLKLLRFLFENPEERHFLIICAYRSNEVDSSHPFLTEIEGLKTEGVRVDRQELHPLYAESIQEMLADTLGDTDFNIEELAVLIQARTDGNPLYFVNFLKNLYDNEILKFNQASIKWECDLNLARSTDLSDSVAELMTRKILTLKKETLELLKLASCSGNKFSLFFLSSITDISITDIYLLLESGLNGGYITSAGGNYTLSSVHLLTGEEEFKFTHDKIQAALYSLISEKEKGETHYKIGKSLLDKYFKKEPIRTIQEETLFLTTNQFNSADKTRLSNEDKETIFKLNVQSGMKALHSNAFNQSLNYLLQAEELSSGLTIDKKEILILYSTLMQSYNSAGKYIESQLIGEKILLLTDEIDSTVNVFYAKIISQASLNQHSDSISTGLTILNSLGLKTPGHPGITSILLTYFKLRSKWNINSINKLSELPPMEDKKALALMRIISALLPSAYILNQELLLFLILKQVELSIVYGNTPLSATAYANFGFVLSGALKNIDAGYKFGELAETLSELQGYESVRTKTLLVIEAFVRHWKKPIKETLRNLPEAFQVGMETGDFEFTAYSAFIHSLHLYLSGKNLNDIESIISSYSDKIQKLHQPSLYAYQKIYLQVIRKLIGKIDSPDYIRKEIDSSAEDKDNIYNFHYYLNNLVLSFLFGNEENIINYAEKVSSYQKYLTGSPLVSFYQLFDSLARLSAITSNRKDLPGVHLKIIKKNQKRILSWAEKCPENHLHRYWLIEAELRKFLKKENASIAYEKAIHYAKISGFTLEESLSWELAGRYFLDTDKPDLGATFLRKAYSSYQSWGANSKVKQLEKEHPGIFYIEKQAATKRPGTISFNPGLNSISDSIELNSLFKMYQSFNGEILIDKLLINLMKILLDYTGALRTILIMEEKNVFYIEAEGDSIKHKIKVLQSLPLMDVMKDANNPTLPFSIIQYVLRTRENVVLGDAVNEGFFSSDHYISLNQSRSVLCIPLLHLNRLSGILYLENNSTPGVFTGERLEILQLLSSQIAISLENAKQYNEMKGLNEVYQKFVPLDFIRLLKKDNITEIKIGDRAEREMSILYASINNFSSLSKLMSPEENFKFVNSFLSKMEPSINKNGGFIDRSTGEAITALFEGKPDNALKAGIAMIKNLAEYNSLRKKEDRSPIKINISIHSESMLLGTIGGQSRIESAIISGAVSLAVKMDRFGKFFDTPILISGKASETLHYRERFHLREIEKIQIEEEDLPITLYECYDTDRDDIIEKKGSIQEDFHLGLIEYRQGNQKKAKEIFQKCRSSDPEDTVLQIYLNRCS